MKIPVLIVSGFLGTGKTTCIQKLIHELQGSRRLMIIENDFGSVSFDAAILAQAGVSVQELTSGCICCSLAGDFKTSLQEALRQVDVDFIVIEPSGVGKLSDIRKACESEELSEKLRYLGAITVADAVRSPLYAKNFGEFFTDQVAHSDVLLVSHSEVDAAKTKKTVEILRKLQPTAPMHCMPWEALTILEDIGVQEALEQPEKTLADWRADGHYHDKTLGQIPEGTPHHHEGCDCHHHGHHDHDHHEGCGCHHDHHHEAGQVFVAHTFSIPTAHSFEEWQQCLSKLEAGYGQVLRAKGIGLLRDADGGTQPVLLQYRRGEISVVPTTQPVAVGTMTVIGANLEEKALHALWESL